MIGGSVFVALELRPSANPRAFADEAQAALRARYGNTVTCGARVVGDAFVLNAAQLTGAEELPGELLELMGELRRT